MASGAMVSGLDRLVEAVEVTEAAAAARAPRQVTGGFMCPHPGCARVFSKRYNQQAHMRIHDGTRPFACQLCGKVFMWKSSLKSHAKMHAKHLAAEAHYNAMVSAAAPSAASRPRQPKALPAVAAVASASSSATAKTGRAIGKSRSKGSYPPRKQQPAVSSAAAGSQKKSSNGKAHASVIVPSSVPVIAALPLQIPLMAKAAIHAKVPPGRQSPDSISRVDHEAATLLTLFR